jgi:hypothetical protein
MSRFLFLILVVVACGDGSTEKPATYGNSLSRILVGAWDVRLSLSEPYPLGVAPKTRRICGTIGFVENHEMSAPSTDDDRGVYDLELSRLGLGWLDVPSYPIAVARSNAPTDNGGGGHDSVAIVLNPGSSERIVLLGHYDDRGINGEWTAQSARGTAVGAFLLSPHISGGGRSRKC